MRTSASLIEHDHPTYSNKHSQLIMAQLCFPFLKLPAEIRNQIYDLLLVRRQHRPCQGLGLKTREPLGLVPAILGVCRQLYYECSVLMYAENWFQAHPNLLTSLPFKTDAARPVTARTCTPLIRRYYFEVRLDVDHRWSEDDLAKAFSGVEALHICAWQASFGTSDLEALERFRKVRNVGRAKVEGCGVSEEFSRWLEKTMECDDGSMLQKPAQLHYNVWENGNR
jgi:hypothetical protein